MYAPCYLSVLLVRRDERRDGDGGTVSEQLGDFGDAADILRAIGGGEAQVAVEAEADVVTVETVSGEGVLEEMLLEGYGYSGLSGGGEAGEPDR